MRQSIFIAGIILVLLGLALWLSGMQKERTESPEQSVCTLEALVCPDGSSVGRTGPQCEFSPCPAQSSYTGILERRDGNYWLTIESPEEIVGRDTYSLPLELRTTNVVGQFIGKEVTVYGSFIEGNTYEVERLEEVTE